MYGMFTTYNGMAERLELRKETVKEEGARKKVRRVGRLDHHEPALVPGTCIFVRIPDRRGLRLAEKKRHRCCRCFVRVGLFLGLSFSFLKCSRYVRPQTTKNRSAYKRANRKVTFRVVLR